MLLTAEQLAALEVAARSWEGTPFCEGTPVKGAGVSCQHCVAEPLIESALLPRIEIPNGQTNWRGQDSSMIAEWIDGSGFFNRIADGREGRALAALAQPGDVLGFKIGSPIHHLMLRLGGRRVLHAVSKHRAFIAPNIPSDWETRLRAVWRLKSLC